MEICFSLYVCVRKLFTTLFIMSEPSGRSLYYHAELDLSTIDQNKKLYKQNKC